MFWDMFLSTEAVQNIRIMKRTSLDILYSIEYSIQYIYFRYN